MKKEQINIYKKVSGSQTENMGDDTLLYSDDTSSKSDYINSMFMDPHHHLSPDYATIVWTYFKSEDRYFFAEIQGAYTNFVAQARSYAYRSSFEVSRDDLNKLNTGKSIAFSKLFKQMPQMHQYDKQEKADTKAHVEVMSTPSTKEAGALAEEAGALADRIIDAIVQKKQLYIGIDAAGRGDLKAENLRTSKEFRTLTAALELLPVGLARYAAFALCADDQHSKLLNQLLVVVYVKGRLSSVPADAINIEWNEAVKPLANPKLRHNEPKTGKIASSLAGEKEPLLDYKEMTDRMARYSTDYDEIKKKNPKKGELGERDWPVWLLEHELTEIKCQNWKELSTCVAQAPKDTRRQLLNQHKEDAKKWPVANEMKDLYAEMDFDAETIEKWRKSQLKDYLWSHKFAFLFEGESVNFDFPRYLNAAFVSKLDVSSKEDLEEWVEKFEDKKALNDDTKAAFVDAFCNLSFNNLEEIVEMLKFLNDFSKGFNEERIKEKANSFSYSKVSDLPVFEKGNLKGLTKGQQDWLKDIIDKVYKEFKNKQYTNIGKFHELIQEGDKHSKKMLEYFTAEDVCKLLNKEDGSKYVDNCEKLLKSKGEKWQEAVLLSLIEKCSTVSNNGEHKLNVKDFKKWKTINDLLYEDDNLEKGKKVIKHLLTWQLLHRIFEINVKEIDNSEDLKNVFNKICPEDYNVSNFMYQRFAKIIIERIKEFPQKNTEEMEEKYNKIFKNLEKEAQKAEEELKKENQSNSPATKWEIILEFCNTHRWWVTGVIGLLCLGFGLCLGRCTANKEPQEPITPPVVIEEIHDNDSVISDTVTTGEIAENADSSANEALADTTSMSEDTTAVAGNTSEQFTSDVESEGTEQNESEEEVSWWKRWWNKIVFFFSE